MDDEGPANKKRRTNHACVNCSRKKTKCDGQHPCIVCSSANPPLQCEYTVPKKRGPPKGFKRGETKEAKERELQRKVEALQAQVQELQGQSGSRRDSFEDDLDDESTSMPVAPNMGYVPVPPAQHAFLPMPPFQVQQPVAQMAAPPFPFPPGQFQPQPQRMPVFSYGPSTSGVRAASDAEAASLGLLQLGVSPVPSPSLSRTINAESLPRSLAPQTEGYSAQSAHYPSISEDDGGQSVMYRGSTSGLPVLAASMPAGNGTNSGSSSARTPDADDMLRTAASIIVAGQGESFGGVAELNKQLGLSEPTPPWLESKLLEAYFAYVHPHWPLLQRQPNGELGFDSRDEPALFSAMCAIASRIYDDQFDAPKSDPAGAARFTTEYTSRIFFNRARFYHIRSNFTPRITSVQALLLMAQREMGTGRAAQGSQYCGIAARMALDLGLHRHPEAVNCQLPPNKVMERRVVYWSIYTVDKICAATLGRPVILRREDADIDLPPMTWDSDLDEHGVWVEGARSFISADTAQQLAGVQRNNLSCFSARVRLGCVLEKIISRLYAVSKPKEGVDDGPKVLASLHSELQEWMHALPLHLRWSPGRARQLPPHVLSMHAWFFSCRLLLFRTFIPRLPQCHAICIDAATSICHIMETYEQAFGLRKLASTLVYAVFTASLVFVGNSASMHVEVAADASSRLQQCIRWLDGMSATWLSAAHHRKLLASLDAVDGATELLASRAASPRLLAADNGFASMLNSRVSTPIPDFSLGRPGLPTPTLPPIMPSTSAPTPSVPQLPTNDQSLDLALPNPDDWVSLNDTDMSTNTFWSQMPLGSEDLTAWEAYTTAYAATLR